MKTIENKIFKFAPTMQIEVSMNSDGDVLICEPEIERGYDTMVWLSNEAALDLATWIFEEVKEENE